MRSTIWRRLPFEIGSLHIRLPALLRVSQTQPVIISAIACNYTIALLIALWASFQRARTLAIHELGLQMALHVDFRSMEPLEYCCKRNFVVAIISFSFSMSSFLSLQELTNYWTPFQLNDYGDSWQVHSKSDTTHPWSMVKHSNLCCQKYILIGARTCLIVCRCNLSNEDFPWWNMTLPFLASIIWHTFKLAVQNYSFIWARTHEMFSLLELKQTLWCPLNGSKNSSCAANKPREIPDLLKMFSRSSLPFWLSKVISNFVSAWCVWLA